MSRSFPLLSSPAAFALILLCMLSTLYSCKPEDTEAPLIQLSFSDTTIVLGSEFVEPVVIVTDNRNCCLGENVVREGSVDVNHYGDYTITYSVEDEEGNLSTDSLNVRVTLAKDSYYGVEWEVSDDCEGILFDYLASLQDCTCDEDLVRAINFGNLGPSTWITWNLSGDYLEQIQFDEERSGITFSGTATATPSGDTINMNYSLIDSVGTQNCSSLWVRGEL
jgi:hypothetical protein